MTAPSNRHSRVRILYVLTSDVSVRFLSGQLGFLTAAGFDVHLAANFGDANARVDPGVTIHSIPYDREPRPWRDLRNLVRTIGLVRRLRPGIVNASTPKAGLIGMAAAWLCRVPVRVHVVRGLRHATLHGNARRVTRQLASLTMALSTVVVFNSKSLRDWAINDGLRPAKRGVVLSGGSGNGLQIERFAHPITAEEARQRLGLPVDGVVVGFIGRLTRDKGVPDLMTAYLSLRERRGDVSLLLVGTFEEGDLLDSSTRDLIATNPDITTVEWTERPEDVYPALDVLVFPSAREGLPNVPLEAQASGVPVVGYAAVGTRDAVAPVASSLLVDVGDVTGLEERLAWVLENPDEAAAMARSAQHWVAETFRPEQVWTDLLQVYMGSGERA